MSRDWLAVFAADERRILADLEALVRCESPSSDSAAVSRLAAHVAGVLRAAGVRAECRPCPPAGAAVVATIGTGDAPGTLLLGHLDTVWPIGAFGPDPWRVDGDQACGPGVFDMKAGAAVAITVLRTLSAREAAPRATLLLVPDEEAGSGASRGLTVELARRHRRVLVLEPSLDGAAKVARKGCGVFTARFRGRAAHAGLEPETGVSALAEMSRFTLFVAGVGGSTAGTTVTATLARAGTASNVVPEEAELTVDARAWTAAEAARVDAALRSYAPADARVSVSIEGGFDRPPLEETAASRRLYEAARRAAGRIGLELGAARVGGASDGNFTAAAGVPTLDGLGPRGGGAHARDEHVLVPDLARRAALLAALLTDAPD
jgi:glutamate carboxypeptidase